MMTVPLFCRLGLHRKITHSFHRVSCSRCQSVWYGRFWGTKLQRVPEWELVIDAEGRVLPNMHEFLAHKLDRQEVENAGFEQP